MTKLKICAKMHLFIIISAILIAIGMAVGTVCHFCVNGFFNYGGEFSSYKCVTITYVTAENLNIDAIKPVCDEALNGFGAYEISYGDIKLGGEIVYKFSSNADSAKIEEAVASLNTKLDKNNSGNNVASFHEVVANEGGSRAITFASIALASSAAFMFLYFIFRYKLRAAFSALLACVHNLGVFVALVAICRVPVGAEMIAIGAAVVVFTMILSCVLFDRTRKNFTNAKYEKAPRLDVVEASAGETRLVNVCSIGSLAVAVVVLGVFAAIAQLWIGALAPCAIAILGLVACFYGTVFFTPSVHGAIDGVCEKVKEDAAAKKVKSSKSVRSGDKVKD